MSSRNSLIASLAVVLCSIVTAIRIEALESANSIEINKDYLKDPVTDLKRLSNPARASPAGNLSEAVLDEGASANLGSILSDIVDNGPGNSNNFVNGAEHLMMLRMLNANTVPQYHSEASNQQPASGKRRLDLDNTALASNSQAARQQRQFSKEVARRQMAMNGPRQQQQQLLQLQSDQTMNNIQNYNRRSMVLNNGNMRKNQMSGIIDNPSAAGRQQQQQYRGHPKFDKNAVNNFRQESRKKQSKPIVNRINDAADDDDIFNDNDDGTSERKKAASSNNDDYSDPTDGDNESDADGDSNDESRPARAASNKRRVNQRGGMRKSRASANNDDDSSSADREDEDEDSESSNNIKKHNSVPAMSYDQTRNLIKGKSSSQLGDSATTLDDNFNGGSSDTQSDISGIGAPSDSDADASHIKNSSTDLQTAAGHHHKHGDHYYQHVEVPKKKAWKFGFKRGNHKHTIERHEKGHKHKFHSSFKWHAKEKCKKKQKCKSVGKMTWEYKHAKKHHG